MKDEEDRLWIALRRDIAIIGRDCVSCFVHSTAFFVVLTLLSVQYSVAVSTAMLVGAVKIFSSDSDTDYLAHTRRHIGGRVSRDGSSDSYDRGA